MKQEDQFEKKHKRGRPSYKTLEDLEREENTKGGKRFNTFLSFIKKKNPTPTLEQLRKILGQKETGHLFDKKHGFPTDGTVIPIQRNYAFKYHVLFRVPLEFLTITKEEEDLFFEHHKVKRSAYLTLDYWDRIKDFAVSLGENPAIEVIPVSVDSQSNPQLTVAYQKLASKIDVAEESIIVWENTFKGNNDNPGNQAAYNNAQRVVFEKIIEVLERKKNQRAKASEFKYTRVFNLSPYNPINDNDVFKVLVDEMSKECLEHLIECFKKYPEYCEFKIAKNVSRFRSHCLIDSKIFLTEDYIKFGDNVIPRIFFLDSLEIPGDFGKLISSIREDDTRSNMQDIRYSVLRDAVLRKMEYLRRLEVGEKLITKVLKLFQREISQNSNSAESGLLNFIYPYLKETIKNEHVNPKDKYTRHELMLLTKSIKNPDDRIFTDIIKRRNEFEQSIQKRREDLKRKSEAFSLTPEDE